MPDSGVRRPGETGEVAASGDATAPPREITLLLEAAGAGDANASDRLLPLVYKQLRRLAQSHMNGEGSGNTLQPTALVHEAYMKLVGGAEVRWNDRRHFFSAAALAMRRILVDRARSRDRDKRGGGRAKVDLHDVAGTPAPAPTDLIALDDALQKLELSHPRRYQVVMLRYFAALSIEETAAALSVSPATVKTDWAMARVWLFRAMGGTARGGED